MNRLFVDVDNTLVKWLGGTPIDHYGAERWEINEDVVAFIKRWRQENDGTVTIWSSGGKDYAQRWAERLLAAELWDGALSKFDLKFEEGDTFVDDQPFDCWSAQSIHPDTLNGDAWQTLKYFSQKTT